ncbi:LytR family transcriptional attenuator [Isoptericola sp. CG 20/1183]|uniref:LytR family transcriptional attenuator n=1 Tax=Isoptericola halotolerans TaxID=300560 RepID=A0ABX5EHG8_9MICO|nr:MULTISPECIES: LCP family protein [Isoptericola]PRZ07690.1 LytR family transcriptional attenuator [Isoptericola halotolerans]PRZ07951.1 LytR family transcriptional attenuator [Isoptericola sp. CG 20/1183]
MESTNPRHAGPHAGHRVLRWTALGLTGVLALVGSGAVAAYIDLQNQIEVSDVDALLGRDGAPEPQAEPSEPEDPTDPFAGKSLDILVMGTDFRDAANAELAGSGDEFHSDTTLVVHISGDRSRIETISIPRDSLVDIPACPRPDGSTTSPQYGAMFNSAFAIGGGPEHDITAAAACTILTVEALTGLTIDDHVVVKMNGVVDIVDAIGGVPMCLPEPVVGDERYSDLALDAGRQVLDGETAIQFLRVRKGEGMGLELGSDLQRIERQQAFIDSMMREVLDQNVITDTPALYRMVQAALRAISTSPELASPRALAGLAWSVRNVDPSDIVFESVPVVDAPSDPNRVVWTSEAAGMWEKFAADESLVPEPEPSTSPSDGGGKGSDDGSEDAEEVREEKPSPSPSPSLRAGVCA